MPQRDTILFDLDGTLLDTAEDILAALNAALRAHGLPELTARAAEKGIGNEARMIAHALSGGREHPLYEQVRATYRERYAQGLANRSVPYPGIPALLARLREHGYRLAVVSNKAQEWVDILRARFFADTIAVAVGQIQSVAPKPAPDMAFAALRQLGSEVARAVFVGDSEYDIETARAAGMPCLCVSWGFRRREALEAAAPAAIADTPRALEALLFAVS